MEGKRKIVSAMKAERVHATPFLQDYTNLRSMGGYGPFQITWTAAKREQLAVSARRTEIYIAPVETRYLRPINQRLVAREHELLEKERPVNEMAERLRTEFARAFMQSPNPRYRVVQRPTEDSVILRLSLAELDATSVAGNVANTATSKMLGPLAAIPGRFTTGSIAIEGKLLDSHGHWLIFQFADRESDKTSYWSARDYTPYGHAYLAIAEWAQQFERVTRDPSWRTMEDSNPWRLKPW